MTFANGDTENGVAKKPTKIKSGTAKYHLQTLKTVSNSLAHLLIGLVCIITLFFTFFDGVPVYMPNIHVALSILGYQFLMAEGILSLCPHNAWSAHLTLVHKKRIHWILQIMGSTLAIAGSAIYIEFKTVHWDTLHGQFGLVALVFTIASLINGLTSLYAYEFRKVIPGKLSKVTHIVFGTVAYAASSISLCYAFDKFFFKLFLHSEVTPLALMGFTGILTFIVMLNPTLACIDRLLR